MKPTSVLVLTWPPVATMGSGLLANADVTKCGQILVKSTCNLVHDYSKEDFSYFNRNFSSQVATSLPTVTLFSLEKMPECLI